MLKIKNKFSLIIIIVLILILTSSFLLKGMRYFNGGKMRARINSCQFELEIADNEERRSLGLGNRDEICQNCGMLFTFSQKGEYSFCMRNMKFPLDFIWIAGDNVVSVTEKVPCNFKGNVNPHISADKVLELHAGTAEKCGIKKGDKIY